MRLLISCPNCQTSYQIDEKQIQQSDGQARCYQCNHVFNAMLNAQPLPDDANVEHLNLPDTADLLDSDSLPADSDDLSDFKEHVQSSLFVPQEQIEIVAGPEDSGMHDSSILTPEELLDIDSDMASTIEPITPLQTQATEEKHYSAFSTWLWAIGILLLLTAFLAQVGWIYRQQLLANPQARELIDTACEHITCDLPPRRAPQAFEIIERQVSAHPDVKGILSLSLLFVNRADFTQQMPGITLSLFDNQQQLIARRSFTYKDYIDAEAQNIPILESGQVQKVFLNLEDPGADVTGFEFNFF